MIWFRSANSHTGPQLHRCIRGRTDGSIRLRANLLQKPLALGGASTDEYTASSVRSSPAIGPSALGAGLRTCSGSLLPTLVAFAATTRDDIHEIVATVIVGNLVACPDVLDGAYDDLVADRIGLGIGPARMIGVTSEVPSACSIDRPTAVDLVEIAVAPCLELLRLLGRELAAFVFDYEGSLPDRLRREKAKAGAGAADTERSLAGHVGNV
jgi:hypothetical protein